MSVDEVRRRSRWMFRALEWDDPRARYPNIWHDGMPREILAFETVVSRLRLGDLIAVFHPASQKHPERAERFLGIVRVTALRRAVDPAYGWVEVEVAHRFHTPIDLGVAPRRVFLCCDPGWPDREVELFGRVFRAAVEEGWSPAEEEEEGGAPPRRRRASGEPGGGDPGGKPPAGPAGSNEPSASGPPPSGGATEAAQGRWFGGADLGGDMRDQRAATWLALLELRGDRLSVVRLEATGRSGFQSILRDSDRGLMRAEAIGLDFPFGLPLPFAEVLLGGPFPAQGWWALARRLDRMSRPEFLVAVEDFREQHGELKRLTDELADLPSPLHRREPDLGAMAYHGIRLIAEERSRYAVRPFETAQGRLLLEVSPSAAMKRLGLNGADAPGTLAALAGLGRLPVEIPAAFRPRCLGSRDALDAVVAARCAAAAVISGETDREAGALSAEDVGRVRHEGWVYGLAAMA